jgi:type VI protein secretion system component VasK
MTRGERFAVAAGAAGLAADLAIAAWFFSPDAPVLRGVPLAPPRIAAMVGVMTYGWLLVAWVLVRRAMRHAKLRHRSTRHVKVARSELSRNTVITVGGMGLLLVPLQFGMLANRIPPEEGMFRARDMIEWYISIGFLSLITLVIIGVAIYGIILLLMPVVYRDVQAQ